ncbi:MAG TPA: xylulokinase [Streptosporangiaceae bacterium]|jgi:xylulokinase
MLVAGVDSSTQSVKVMLCQAEDGTVVGTGSAPHPGGTECDPAAWWDALLTAGAGLLERADAVGVAAQQHGMIAVDEAGQVVRPALLWNDVRSARQAEELIAEQGGPGEWARRAGSVPTASFTVTKLRWMAEHEPANAARTAMVLLPHDWLTWQLATRPALGERPVPELWPGIRPVTDRGDASGTGYFSPADSAWLPELAAAALGHAVDLPDVAAPADVAGQASWGAVLSAGTGDNMGAALGLCLREGDVVVSIGTSGTAFAVTEAGAADPAGAVAGFADATGRFLPLVCTLNAARVLSVTNGLLGVDAAAGAELALAAEPGAGGLTLLPYLDGERTPNRPDATGVLTGLTTANGTRENLARASAEAVLCSLADAVGHLVEVGLTPRRVLLIGGGAKSRAIRLIAPSVFGTEVVVPEPAEYVARGAARQAAWALAGTSDPPDWPAPASVSFTGDPIPHIRTRYAALRDATAPNPQHP